MRKLKTAIIMCAGFGKRLKPLTNKVPKPLLEIDNKSLLENTIDLLFKLKIKKILLNSHHLSQQIKQFVLKKKLSKKIKVFEEKRKILNTGGGISNIINSSKDKDYLILNPDTIWTKNHLTEIIKMKNLYFSKKALNMLLVVKKKKSFDQRLTDLEAITNEKIPENSVAIETAREHGDLRENAEYHMAKDEQKVLLARQAELQSDLARAQSTDFSDAPSDSVGIGTIVNLVDQSSGEAQTYSILGAWDSDPDNSVLSYETPLGQKLLGKKVGEEVLTDIDGVSHSWRVEGLSRWVDRN